MNNATQAPAVTKTKTYRVSGLCDPANLMQTPLSYSLDDVADRFVEIVRDYKSRGLYVAHVDEVRPGERSVDVLIGWTDRHGVFFKRSLPFSVQVRVRRAMGMPA